MITAPEANITLPEKEIVALANIRQEILIGEEKVRQLQDAQRQIKGEIRTDLDEKMRIAGAIETLKIDREPLEKEVSNLRVEAFELKKQNDKEHEFYSKIVYERTEIEHKNQDEAGQLKAEWERLEAEKNQIADEKSALDNAKASHEIRIERLNKAINEA